MKCFLFIIFPWDIVGTLLPAFFGPIHLNESRYFPCSVVPSWCSIPTSTLSSFNNGFLSFLLTTLLISIAALWVSCMSPIWHFTLYLNKHMYNHSNILFSPVNHTLWLWPFSSKHLGFHHLLNDSMSKFSCLFLWKRIPLYDHFFSIPIKQKHISISKT